MRIPVKLTLGLAATALLTFGTYAVWHVRAEERELRAAIEHETRMLSRSLQVSLENAFRDGQLEDARETVERLEVVDRQVHVLVFDAAGTLRASSGDASPPSDHLELRAVARETGRLELRYEPPAEPERLVAAVPLEGDRGERLGVLVVARPLADLREDIDATRRSSILVVLVVVACTALVVFGMGALHISRPIDKLREGMRRVRTGDLATPLPDGTKDEIGALAREFNEMLRELREARERWQAEADARRQFQRALQQSDKLATVGQLSAGLAHEIGSPLQVLIGRARALLTRRHDEDATRRQADIIVSQGERIARIVQQLLHFAGRRAAVRAATDVERACRDVVDLLEVEARRRRVSLVLEVAPNLPRGLVDGDQMQQVVLNLATNALAATPEGGLVRIDLAPAPGLDRLCLVVRDTGQGIAEDVLPRIFEPFFTTRGEDGGTGLGLAVVQAIVQEHGGSVRVESGATGTCFSVELPALPEEAQA